MLDNQRHLFDIPEDVAYLNCAYTAPMPLPVAEAGRAALEARRHPWQGGTNIFFDALERARSGFARLLGASAENVAVVGSTSYALAVAAKNLPLEPGQRVVVLDEQFPSNVYPWRTLPGVSLTPVARPAEGTWSQAVEAAVTQGVGLVALPHCHWTDGTVFDLAAIRAACDRVGAHLVVDATQSAGMLPLDLAAVRPDFLAVTAHKWLFCPYGMAFLYVDDKWLDGRPIEENWLNREGSEDFAGLTDYRDGYRPGARRYDMGQASSFVQMAMADAALDLVNAWEPGAAAALVAKKTARLAAAAQAFGLSPTPAPERSPHLVGLALPRGDARPLAAALAEMGVYVSARGKSLRLSCHVYVTDQDLERCFTALARGLST